MGVVKQLLRLPLGRGLDQSADPRLVSPGSVGEARNVVVDRAGRYQKRTGWGQLPILDEGGATMASRPDRADAAGVEILQTASDGSVRAWGPGRGRWESIHYLPPFRAQNDPLTRTQISIVAGFMVRFGATSQYELIGWQHSISGGAALAVYAQIRDAETHALIGRDALVYTPTLTSPIAFRVGTSAWVVHALSPTVKVERFAGDLASFPTFTVGAIAAGVFDAAPVDGNSRGLVAMGDITSATDWQVHLISETGGIVTPAVTYTEAESVIELAVCDAGSEYRVLVLTSDGGSPPSMRLMLYRLDSSLAVLGGGSIDIEVGPYDCGSIGVAYKGGKTWVTWVGKLASTDDLICVHTRVVDSGGTLSAWRKQIWRCSVAARALVTDEGVFQPLFATTTDANSASSGLHLVMVRLDNEETALPPQYCGVLLRQVATVLTHVQHWTDVGGGEYQIACGVVTRDQLYGRSVTALDRVTLREERSLMPAVSLPQQLVWGGAGLWGYDGNDVHDVNFVQPPYLYQDPLAPYATGGAPNFAQGAYLYRARYEYVDDRGVMHVSPWSNDKIVDLSGVANATKIKLYIASTQLTQHGMRALSRNVTVAIYRSTVDGIVGGKGTLYRLVGYGDEALIAFYNSESFLWEDDEMDASSAGLGSVQFSGGTLEPRVLPAVRAMCVHQGRLWCATAEPERAVWFSQQLQTDETPRWHEGLRVQLTDSDEPVVALASLDQTLVVFTRSRIFAVSGLGPVDTGRDGAFSGPSPIATAFGCLDAGSVVSTSRGVYFRAEAGICLLSRDLSVTVVGDPVRDLVDDGEIVHAVYHEAQARVVWHVVGSDGGSRFILYDERHSVWTRADSLEADTVQHLSYCRESSGLLVCSSRLLLEGYGAAAGFDGDPADPTWFAAELASPWLRAGEVGGWMDLSMVHLEGELQAPSTWKLYFDRDYTTTGAQEAPLELTDTRGSRVVKQIGPATRTSQAFRVRLVEQTPGALPADKAAPQGCTWWGCTVETTQVQGLARIDLSHRHGAQLWQAQAPFSVRLAAAWSVGSSAAPSAQASGCPRARCWAATSTVPTTTRPPSTPTRSTPRSTTPAATARSATPPSSAPPRPRTAPRPPPTGRWPTRTGACRWRRVVGRWVWPTTSRPSSGARRAASPSSSSPRACSASTPKPRTTPRTSGAGRATSCSPPRRPAARPRGRSSS